VARIKACSIPIEFRDNMEEILGMCKVLAKFLLRHCSAISLVRLGMLYLDLLTLGIDLDGRRDSLAPYVPLEDGIIAATLAREMLAPVWLV
jgi:hypothetical protein